jgi:hypothetical protein
VLVVNLADPSSFGVDGLPHLLIEIVRGFGGAQNARILAYRFFTRPAEQVRKRLIRLNDVPLQIRQDDGIGGIQKGVVKKIEAMLEQSFFEWSCHSGLKVSGRKAVHQRRNFRE